MITFNNSPSNWLATVIAPPIALLPAPAATNPPYISSCTAYNACKFSIAVWFEGGCMTARGSSGNLESTTNGKPTNINCCYTSI